jgi:hypothetical protein
VPDRFRSVEFDRLTSILGRQPKVADGFLEFAAMPSLIRLLMVLGLLGGFAYGAMFALANFVQPKQREMSITIPSQRLAKPN